MSDSNPPEGSDGIPAEGGRPADETKRREASTATLLSQLLRKPWAKLAVALFAGWLLAQVFQFDLLPRVINQTYGRILIDTPEVYTRERLVNDRFRQDAWLREQLNQDVTFGIQGSLAQSQFRRTSISAATQAAPGVSEAGDSEAEQAIQGEGAEAEAPDAEDPVSSPTEKFRDELSYREEIRNEIIENQLDDRHDIAGNTLYRLKFDATVLPGEATSAYAMIEVSIESPIDLPGATDGSFQGKPDAGSELPPNGKQDEEKRPATRYRQIQRLLEGGISKGSLDSLASLYESWLADTQAEITERVGSLRDKLRDGDIESRASLRRFLPKYFNNYALGLEDGSSLDSCIEEELKEPPPDSEKAPSAPTELAAREKCIEKWWEGKRKTHEREDLLFARVQDELQIPIERYADVGRLDGEFFVSPKIDFDYFAKDEEDGFQKRRDELVKAFGDAFPDNLFVRVSQPGVAALDLDGLWADELPDDGVTIEVLTGLASFISNLVSKPPAVYTYAVTPKESVQRISDSMRVDLQQELGLQASGPAAEAAIRHAQGRNSQMQSIRRQPLVVGYAPREGPESGATMGWLIGPRFQIPSEPTGSVEFRHVPVQQALTAIVSVPSWWPEMRVTARSYWLTGRNQQEHPEEGILDTRISLPGDLESLHDVLNPGSGPKEPKISQDLDDLYLDACKPGSLLIPGEHLWRSTVVMLGPQRANSIAVLPDMKGIVASFDPVRAPSNWDAREANKHTKLRLRVWTSEGMARAPKEVSINTETCKQAEETIDKAGA